MRKSEVCPNCQEWKDRHSKLCKKCRDILRKPTIIRNCKNCNEKLNLSKNPKKIFCNRSCSAIWNNKNREISTFRKRNQRFCQKCNKDITYEHDSYRIKRKYCVECGKGKHIKYLIDSVNKNNKELRSNWKERKKGKCQNCNEPISAGASRCRKCVNTVDLTGITLGEYLGEHTCYKDCNKYTAVRSLGYAKNKKLQKLPCQKCGYDRHVDICHIKPVSSFSLNDLLDDIHHPSNILVLCRNCHWEFDHQMLELKDIPPRQT